MIMLIIVASVLSCVLATRPIYGRIRASMIDAYDHRGYSDPVKEFTESGDNRLFSLVAGGALAVVWPLTYLGLIIGVYMRSSRHLSSYEAAQVARDREQAAQRLLAAKQEYVQKLEEQLRGDGVDI